MARKQGYGGVANTNGARTFTGKTPSTPTGRVMSSLARHGGLASKGGIAGKGGGLAG